MTKKVPEKFVRLGRRIQKLRKANGITQEQLAERVNVSTTWIGYIETGYRVPNMKLLTKIANVLKVNVSNLIPL